MPRAACATWLEVPWSRGVVAGVGAELQVLFKCAEAWCWRTKLFRDWVSAVGGCEESDGRLRWSCDGCCGDWCERKDGCDSNEAAGLGDRVEMVVIRPPLHGNVLIIDGEVCRKEIA